MDVTALAREVLAQLAASRPEAAAVVVQAQAAPPSWPLDLARTRLLLRNLLDNALRHGEGEHPPELTLAAGAGRLRITVRDHGVGVPDAARPNLADAFWRPDAARTRDAGGVGLGLHLCRLVTDAHGGWLRFEPAHPGLRVIAELPDAH